MRPERDTEVLARLLWLDLPYRVAGTCTSCGRGRGDDGLPLFVAGHTPSLRICLACFDAAGSRAPRRIAA